MIGYVTLGVRDLAKAVAFWEPIAAELDAPRFMEGETFVAWGRPGGPPGIGVTLPFDKRPATWGNGAMVALAAKDPAQVKRIYDMAIAAGGMDEGPPGLRDGGFYAAYFRDIDGNKLNAFCMEG